MMMKGLLIAAHGSRRQQSNDEIIERTRQLADGLQQDFDSVRCGFLEFASPTAEKQLEAMIAEGMKDIVIVPMFLAAGKHVTADIPALIRQTQERCPDVTLTVTTHLGAIPGMNHVIIDHVKQREQQTYRG